MLIAGTKPLPLVTDARLWRRAALSSRGAMVVGLDEKRSAYGIEYDAARERLVLQRHKPEGSAELGCKRPDETHLVLEGDFFGEPVRISLHRLADPLLLTRSFRWVNEVSFNR